MSAERGKILDNNQIVRKLERMAYQIYEQNFDEKHLIIIGIANKGFVFAQQLKNKLEEISKLKISIHKLKMDKRIPLKGFEFDTSLNLTDKNILLVDDVGNTGRTLFYAMTPLMNQLPRKIQTAVLVDRMHKTFPIQPTFTGLSLATTLNQEVIVELEKNGSAICCAYLQ